MPELLLGLLLFAIVSWENGGQNESDKMDYFFKCGTEFDIGTTYYI